MQRFSAVAAYLMLVVACGGGDGGTAAHGGGGGGLSVQEGGYVPGTMACPTIACATNVRQLLSYPLRFEETRDIALAICRNSTCFNLKLPPDAQRPAVTSAPFFVDTDPTHNTPEYRGERVDVRLLTDGLDRLYLTLQWRPSSAADLRDGDRYSAKIVDRNGMTRALMEQEVRYQDTSIGKPGAPCFQECKSSDLDLRQSGP